MTKFQYYFYAIIGYSLFLIGLLIIALFFAIILDYYLGGGM